MNRYRHPILVRCVLMVFLVTAVSPAPAWAAANQEQPELRNVDWRSKDGVIVINYDLIGPVNTEYEVVVVLLSEADPAFRLVPTAVAGHVGRGYFAGVSRTITWDFRNDRVNDVKGDRYYFEISASIVQARSSVWYYVLGGLGLTAGGLAIALSGKKSEPPSSTTLPSPPGRP